MIVKIQTEIYKKRSCIIKRKKVPCIRSTKKKERDDMTNQIKLLKTLAKEIKTEEKSKDKVIASLHSAKILTKQGNFTGKYSNLKRVVLQSK